MNIEATRRLNKVSAPPPEPQLGESSDIVNVNVREIGRVAGWRRVEANSPLYDETVRETTGQVLVCRAWNIFMTKASYWLVVNHVVIVFEDLRSTSNPFSLIR